MAYKYYKIGTKFTKRFPVFNLQQQRIQKNCLFAAIYLLKAQNLLFIIGVSAAVPGVLVIFWVDSWYEQESDSTWLTSNLYIILFL